MVFLVLASICCLLDMATLKSLACGLVGALLVLLNSSNLVTIQLRISGGLACISATSFFLWVHGVFLCRCVLVLVCRMALVSNLVKSCICLQMASSSIYSIYLASPCLSPSHSWGYCRVFTTSEDFHADFLGLVSICQSKPLLVADGSIHIVEGLWVHLNSCTSVPY